MRPDDERRKLRRAGVARARLLLRRDMPWLPGFPRDPQGLVWQAFPWERPGVPETIRIDRESLRRMEMSLMKLRLRFPHALPKVVADVDDWLTRMDYVLALAKQVVHESRPILVDEQLADAPVSRRWCGEFSRLRARLPRLQALLDAVFFLELTRVGRRNDSRLAWIEQNSAELARLVDAIPLEASLAICQFADDVDPQWLKSLIRLLTDRRLAGTACRVRKRFLNLEQAIRKAAKGRPFELPEPSGEPSVQRTLLDLVGWLTTQKTRQRLTATALIHAISPPELTTYAGRVEKWMEEMETGLNRAADPGLGRLGPERRRAELTACRKLNNRFRSHSLEVGTIEEFGRAVANLPSVVADEPVAAAVLAVLSAFAPADRLTALRLFAIWQADELLTAKTGATVFFRELAKLFARRGIPEVLLQHWRELLNSKTHWPLEFVGDAVRRSDDRRVGVDTLRMLEQVVFVEQRSLPDSQLLSLVEFASARRNLKRDGRTYKAYPIDALLLAALDDAAVGGPRDRQDSATTTQTGALEGNPDSNERYLEAEIRATLAIGRGEASDVEILKSLRDTELAEAVEDLGAHIIEERVRELVRRLVRDRQQRLLARMSLLVKSLAAASVATPSLADCEGDRGWIAFYPSALETLLSELAEVAPDAGAIAERLLSKAFPRPTHVARELREVERRLAEAERTTEQWLAKRLRIRRDNLRERIRAPVMPSAGRLARLQQKLRRRIDHEQWARFVARCSGVLGGLLRSRWQLPEDAEKLLAPPFDELTYAVLRLTGRSRELGLWILGRRLRSAADDYRDEPANSEFLASLQESGVEIEPWLDTDFSLSVADGRGPAYTLRFTRDPLDVLLMGKHFDTCLSPE